MTGRTIAIETDTLATGWTVVVARIPPRVCGAPNTAAANRLRQLIGAVNPSAFDPVREAVAQAVVRDVPLESKPPNCEGQRAMYAHLPPYVVDSTRDDDEGSLGEPARYPPGVACNVTGECEE